MDAPVAVTVHWTNPAYSATDSTCQGPGLPAELERVELRGIARWAAHDTVLAARDARGRDGAPDSVTLALTGQWSVWVVAIDRAGNASCASRVLGLNVPPLEVPPAFRAPDTVLTLYDLAGRRLPSLPTRPGVYFARSRAGERRRIVVVR
jgi:hypothetical protein